jgi:hypothetical protein
MKPLNKIKTTWSSELAYAVGLIATDGCLYKDGRHLAFVSKDLQLIKTFNKCLGLKVKIARKKGGFVNSSFAYWVQFGDVNFYRFLVSLGLTPRKSKTIGELKIPNLYFFDFLRGSFDGDGTFYSYWDKRWKSSFMFYLSFASASKEHLVWLREKTNRLLSLKGELKKFPYAGVYKLNYAKKEGLKIIERMYSNSQEIRLERKYKKVYTALAIDKKIFKN